MMRSGVLALIGSALAVMPVQAACPSIVPGSSIEAVQANQARTLCLQQQTDALADQQANDLQVMTLERSVQNLQLQRRFDQLPTIQPYVPPSP